MTAAAPAPERAWLGMREKGSLWGVRFVLAVATLLGRAPARLVLRVIAAYYVLVHRRVRAASRAYLTRAYGRPATFGMCYRHVLRFAEVILDRAFLLTRRRELFDVTYTGREHLLRLHAERRGAILVSAHFGSMAAMDADGDAREFHIRIAGYFENARMINSVLERLDPAASARVIHLDFGSVASVLAIKERIAAGDLIAMTPDRFGPGERVAEVDFLGGRAAFSTGPFLLASLLGCPLYLVFAVYRPPNHYDLVCEPLGEPVAVSRRERSAVMAAQVQRFAMRLEHYCRLTPENWFNFFDFWSARR